MPTQFLCILDRTDQFLSYIHSPEPRDDAFCLGLNFNISKLVYCLVKLNTVLSPYWRVWSLVQRNNRPFPSSCLPPLQNESKIAFTLEGIKFNLNSFRRNKFFPNLFSKQLFPLEVLSIFEPAIHLVCSINLNK